MAGDQAVLEIDLRAVVANWRALCARHPSGPVAGVVKADGYGLGARQVAAALHRAGCRHFFVAYLNEALAIRDLVPGAMLGVLSGLIHGTEDECVAYDLTPVLGSLDEIARWRGRGRDAILQVDTGMSRLGLSPAEVAVLSDDPTWLEGLTIRYVMSHLVSSERPDDTINATAAAALRRGAGDAAAGAV